MKERYIITNINPMKTKTIIEELTQEDLVDLLCTATYGSEWLSISADPDGLEIADKDCIEDIWAKCLLSGRTIFFTDYNADEGESYGDIPHTTDEDGHTTYLVSLEDIKVGLAKCADLTFKYTKDHYGDEDLAYISECWRNYRNNHGELDQPQAEALVQIIIFGELIYG